MNVVWTVIPIVLSVSSVVITLIMFFMSNSKSNYLEMDKQYADLLKLALKDCSLRDHKVIQEKYDISDGEFIGKYNIYAYLVWNCLETLYDLSIKLTKKKQMVLDNTWLPVILEENKIHYAWFKDNQRLFKPSFQNYVNGLNNVTIRMGKKAEFWDIYEFMKKQFPANELKSFNMIERLLDGGAYKMFVIENTMLKGEDKYIGYAFAYEIPEYKSLWLDYLAIRDIYQNSGYGSLLFNKIQSLVGGNEYNIFMELEKPGDSPAGSVRNRRINFYKKHGAAALDLIYKLPTPDGGMDMQLMCKPYTHGAILNKELLDAVISKSLSIIHEDLKCTPQVIQENLSSTYDIKL